MTYLLDRGLIDAESVVAGNLTIFDVSHRNYNHQIINKVGPSYLVKQGFNPDGDATLAHEAYVYQYLQNGPENDAGLSRYLPRFCGYDQRERLLILELLPDAEDLVQYHQIRRRFPKMVASMMGEALGILHSRQLEQDSRTGSRFPCRRPWALMIHQPHVGMLRDLSEANLHLIQTLQHSKEFCLLADHLAREWRSDRLIHYDLKWNNWITAWTRRTRKPQLRMIDWELAAIGDACWDVGAVLGSYLSFWLSSIPVTGEDVPDQFLELACQPLERMQPAIRDFWGSYVQQMGLEPSLADQWLFKSVRYGAVRLVQAAFENMQRSSTLTAGVIPMLQLSLNILKRPEEAAVLLLGIPINSRVTA